MKIWARILLVLDGLAVAAAFFTRKIELSELAQGYRMLGGLALFLAHVFFVAALPSREEDGETKPIKPPRSFYGRMMQERRIGWLRTAENVVLWVCVGFLMVQVDDWLKEWLRACGMAEYDVPWARLALLLLGGGYAVVFLIKLVSWGVERRLDKGKE